MLRVRTVGTGVQGVPYLSTMYFAGSGASDAQTAATAVRTFWDGCKAHILTGLTLTVDSQVVEFDAVDGKPTATHAVTTTAVVATGSGSALPPSNQGLIRWFTPTFIGGRQLRGRTFIPYPSTTSATGGVPAAGYIAGLQAAATTLVGTTAPDLAIWSRTHGQGVFVNGSSVWTQFAVLRSRRT